MFYYQGPSWKKGGQRSPPKAQRGYQFISTALQERIPRRKGVRDNLVLGQISEQLPESLSSRYGSTRRQGGNFVRQETLDHLLLSSVRGASVCALVLSGAAIWSSGTRGPDRTWIADITEFHFTKSYHYIIALHQPIQCQHSANGRAEKHQNLMGLCHLLCFP